MAKKRQRLTPSLIESRQRSVEALKLRLSGLTFRDIAESLEMSVGAVHEAIDRRMEHMADEPAAELLKLERVRLDRLLEAAWPGAMNGDPKRIDSVLRIMERRAKLLGLDAAFVVEHRPAVKPGSLEELEQRRDMAMVAIAELNQTIEAEKTKKGAAN